MILKKQAHLCITTHLFSDPTAFPAISGGSKSVGEVWVAGAAAMLTAAAVPSRQFENSNASGCDGEAGDGHELDGCSNGANAVDDWRTGG